MPTPSLLSWTRCLTGALLAAASMCATAVNQAAIQPAPLGTPFGHRSDQIAASGFIEQEFWLTGLAASYASYASLGADGKWDAAPASNASPYKTAILVRRPADPAAFNGIVVVEWLNVSSNYSLDIDWDMAHEAFLREGYAYVGVNAQKVGINGLQKVNPSRYGSLSIGSDDLSYDILSQAGKAVRDQYATLLGGLQPQAIIATGHSQSAARLTTYVNAIQKREQVFDGFMIHGRANTGAPLRSGDKLPSNASIRDDLKAPVFLLQSEMDVTLQAATSRQPDTGNIRQWEVAGSSHADQYMLDSIGLNSVRDTNWTPPNCVHPYNAMPFYEVEIAAFEHLRNWITKRAAPPVAPRLKRNLFGFIEKDKLGNAIGGVRLPEIDVPIATYGQLNFTTGSLAFLDLFACGAGGTTKYFSGAQLQRLYPDHATYVNMYKDAADGALAKGFIRPVEYANSLARARAAAIPY